MILGHHSEGWRHRRSATLTCDGQAASRPGPANVTANHHSDPQLAHMHIFSGRKLEDGLFDVERGASAHVAHHRKAEWRRRIAAPCSCQVFLERSLPFSKPRLGDTSCMEDCQVGVALLADCSLQSTSRDATTSNFTSQLVMRSLDSTCKLKIYTAGLDMLSGSLLRPENGASVARLFLSRAPGAQAGRDRECRGSLSLPSTQSDPYLLSHHPQTCCCLSQR